MGLATRVETLRVGLKQGSKREGDEKEVRCKVLDSHENSIAEDGIGPCEQALRLKKR